MDNNFSKVTRRMLAWGLGGIAALTIAFVTIWGTVQGITELVTLGVGVFAGAISTIAVFYFSKEE